MLIKRKKVTRFVIVIAVTLAGLFLLQTLLLRSAFNSKEQAFKRNVLAALGAISQKVTTRQAISFAFDTDSLVFADSTNQSITIDMTNYSSIDQANRMVNRYDFWQADTTSPPFKLENDTLKFNLFCAQRLRLESIDPVDGRHQLLIDTFCTAGWHAFPLDSGAVDKENYFVKIISDSSTVVMKGGEGVTGAILDKEQTGNEHRMMIMSVVSSLQDAKLLSLEEQIKADDLDSLISLGMRENGIDLEYNYGIFDIEDSLRFGDTINIPELLKTELRAPLFPQNFLSEPAEIAVIFPGQKAWLWSQMLPLATPTAILMLIIVGCFIYSLQTIIRQRRFADHMKDFIGNMTHEFKTPLSTVKLAAEAIARDDIINQPEQVNKFNETIIRETNRLKEQADKILQMAELEEGRFELEPEPVDLHAVIRAAVSSVELKVNQRGGQINAELSAGSFIVNGDRFHLTNAIRNVLDNAEKYSPDHPTIRIVTSNQDDGREIQIRISDRGIGIPKEFSKHIFDKYYRVPQGNIQNVKGYGLGLSYVKLIIDAQHGRLVHHSRSGEGTEIVITLPLMPPSEQT